MQCRKDYFRGAHHSCVVSSGAPSAGDGAAWRSQRRREPGEHPLKSRKLNHDAQNLGMWPCFYKGSGDELNKDSEDGTVLENLFIKRREQEARQGASWSACY